MLVLDNWEAMFICQYFVGHITLFNDMFEDYNILYHYWFNGLHSIRTS